MSCSRLTLPEQMVFEGLIKKIINAGIFVVVLKSTLVFKIL